MRHQFQRQELLHWRDEQQQAEEVGEKAGNNQQNTADDQRHAFDHLRRRTLPCGHLLLH